MREEGKIVGRRGEEEAGRYLRERGHVVLARNFRSGHTELDLVTLAEDGLHFVEVKSRTAPCTAEPQDAVGPTKQRRLIRAAQGFLRCPGRAALQEQELFFDILTVVFDKDTTYIQYYPQAFIPLYV